MWHKFSLSSRRATLKNKNKNKKLFLVWKTDRHAWIESTIQTYGPLKIYFKQQVS